MDYQSFFDEHMDYTGDEKDFVLLKDLYNLLKPKPNWNIFKMNMILTERPLLKKKYINGKTRCNVYLKFKLKDMRGLGTLGVVGQ